MEYKEIINNGTCYGCDSNTSHCNTNNPKECSCVKCRRTIEWD